MTANAGGPLHRAQVLGSRAVAWLLLGLIHLSIRLLGVGRTFRCLARLSPRPIDGRAPPREVLVRVARTVNLARNSTPAFCLRRALLIWWLLRWWRADARIHCDMGPALGHAWVELEGQVIGDRADLAGSGRFGDFGRIFGVRP
ncbi:MAG: lasso peptide biosynthesis B2 protein [Xanthomonadales bacterium]|nr:lasso peptide biosynthesis B2 protein [Xanthomonadales bacterium]